MNDDEYTLDVTYGTVIHIPWEQGYGEACIPTVILGPEMMRQLQLNESEEAEILKTHAGQPYWIGIHLPEEHMNYVDGGVDGVGVLNFVE